MVIIFALFMELLDRESSYTNLYKLDVHINNEQINESFDRVACLSLPHRRVFSSSIQRTIYMYICIYYRRIHFSGYECLLTDLK
jgi:hypothetical protein